MKRQPLMSRKEAKKMVRDYSEAIWDLALTHDPDIAEYAREAEGKIVAALCGVIAQRRTAYAYSEGRV